MPKLRAIGLLALLATACLPDLQRRRDGDDTARETQPDDTDVEPSTDEDGDGWSVEDGDCDDENQAINPGVASDGCNGRDNDCDGQVDEDFARDGYEPNDDRGYYLDSLELDEQVDLYGYLFPESDEDRFRFWLEDESWMWLSIGVWLEDVPSDADYAIDLVWVEDLHGEWQGTVASSDRAGDGGAESLEFTGHSSLEDGGMYEVVVRSVSGDSCFSPYWLAVVYSGW
jgi:hypothetical protein